jgi:hypothetical protein
MKGLSTETCEAVGQVLLLGGKAPSEGSSCDNPWIRIQDDRQYNRMHAYLGIAPREVDAAVFDDIPPVLAREVVRKVPRP